jgi:PKD domain
LAEDIVFKLPLLNPPPVLPLLCAGMILACGPLHALDRPEKTYQVFQFPADQIPRIDGQTDDWALVPEAYTVGTDQLTETDKHRALDPKNLDVRVKVGWVKGLNRLYFLYEASDDVWDFARPDLHNDTFEVVVDGDASGGPLVDIGHADIWKPEAVGEARAKRDPRISIDEAHWTTHGVHAQNYHIFTPAVEKDWALAWGSPTWTKEFPHANSAQSFNFKHGEGGKYVLEFWITPYDYAGPEGPQRAVESVLSENKIIGLGWIVIDYDDVNSNGKSGFWVLSSRRTMYGNASDLPAFRLMPLELSAKKPIEAKWSFHVVDPARRLVAFADESVGDISSWHWSFGDGATSQEQYPLHTYQKPGNYVVILEVEGPAGKSRRSKVWDVQLR